MSKNYTVKMYGKVTKTFNLQADNMDDAIDKVWDLFTLEVSDNEKYEQELVSCEEELDYEDE